MGPVHLDPGEDGLEVVPVWDGDGKALPELPPSPTALPPQSHPACRSLIKQVHTLQKSISSLLIWVS